MIMRLLKPHSLINLAMIIAVLGLMVSCKAHEQQMSSLSGEIVMVNDTGNPDFDPVDYSGVVIGIYHQPKLDTTLVRINQEYPTIGVIIDQIVSFDHRLQDPIMTTYSDVVGSFELNNLVPGVYNVVVAKPGWGTIYLHDVDIKQGMNDLSDPDVFSDPDQIWETNSIVRSTSSSRGQSLSMFPVVLVPSVNQENVLFKSDHTYAFQQDTIIFGELLIEGGVTFIVDPGVKIDTYGQITNLQEDGYWKITSSDGFDQLMLRPSIMPFNKFTVYGPDIALNLRNLIFEYSLHGLNSYVNSLTVSRSIFRFNDIVSIIASSQSNIFLDNLIYGNQRRGIYAYNNTMVQSSIFSDNYDSCLLSESVSTVSNNYFVGCYIGLRPFYGNVNVVNNCFDMNSNAISATASTFTTAYNNFYNNEKDVELCGYYVQDFLDYCHPQIEFNNFFGNGFYVHLKGSNSMFGDGFIPIMGVDSDQVFPNNYLIASNLQMHIFDANYLPTPPSLNAVATFSPRRPNRNPAAGIR